MGLVYWDGQEVFQDEKELKMKFEKMGNKYPLTLDVKQSNIIRRCKKRCPTSNELIIPGYIRFFSLNKNLVQNRPDLPEDRVSNSLSLFCRTASLFNIPVNMRSSDIFIKRSRHCRRSRSTNDLGDFFVEYASVAGPENVIIRPSVQCIFDSMEGTVMARSLLKSSLFFQLGTLDSAVRPYIGRSFNVSPMKSSELTTSPFGVCNALSQVPKVEVTPGSQKSKLKISGRLVSCSSTDSANSYQSNSSPCCSLSKGLLHCVWKDGSPYFVFTAADDCGEVYVTNPRRIESSVDKALDYLYSFHTRTGDKASDVVGKMKVSSSLVLDSNRSKLMETEFVLFGSHDDHSREMQGSSSSVVKSKGFSKKVANIFRPSHSSKNKSACKFGEPSSQVEDLLRDPCLGEFSDLDESVLVNHLENGFPPNLELAAIVIKDSQLDSNKEAAVGGWGLKFLQKVTVEHADSSINPSLHSESCEGSHVKNRGASRRSMNILIPAAFHGGPTTQKGGPSSLIERWRSDGHCDCGGWDIGCPLTVLHESESIVSKTFPQEETQEACKSVDLFIEGSKQSEPTVKMVNMNEGYRVSRAAATRPAADFAVAPVTASQELLHLHLQQLKPVAANQTVEVGELLQVEMQILELLQNKQAPIVS